MARMLIACGAEGLEKILNQIIEYSDSETFYCAVSSVSESFNFQVVYGKKLLWRIAKANNRTLLDVLLPHVRSGKILSAIGENGDSALHIALRHRVVSLVMPLIYVGINLHVLGWRGRTALHEAIYNWHFEAALQMSELRAVVDISDNGGYSELMPAVGRMPQSWSTDGTARHCAVPARDPSMVELVLRGGSRVPELMLCLVVLLFILEKMRLCEGRRLLLSRNARYKVAGRIMHIVSSLEI